ncbi:putative quinol monooxygenase [Mucilaginibacter sp.]|jgi:quinol monooxygenase YgiN|uniref:putative quinol monooxygenase n=1 Tax=Mucilaginibacter sp. TaxID=1882438 RepID=UPI0025DA20EA|nr:putative quinol monooxygenase [Mucilaginibacter sp.]
MKIYLTALVKSKPGFTEEIKGYLDALVAGSIKEEACLQYELYQSTEDETQFIFHETWASQEGLDIHAKQPHIKLFIEQVSPILDGKLTIYKTDRVS